jgi:hypothetical protein
MVSGLRAKLDRIVSRDSSWRWLVIGVAALALVVRLGLIAGTGGGFNLRIFYWFGDLVARGINPYHAPPGSGAHDPQYGDNPPMELIVFAGLLKIHNSPDTLRVFFALVDVSVIALVGFLYPLARIWRANFILFYGFNPLLLEEWTAFADDKAILLALIILVLLGLEQGRLALSWSATAVLVAFKWLGVFFLLPLALESRRRVSGMAMALGGAAFVAFVALWQLPYFPDNLEAFSRRSDRISIDPPIHASPTQVLSHIGIYSSAIPRVFIVVSLLAVYLLFALRRLDAREAVVLSIFCSYVALPDEGANRMLLITLPFLFIVAMTARRWLALWAVSLLAAAAVLVEFRNTPIDLVEQVFGSYGSLKHVLFANAVMALVVFYYLKDRLSPREAQRSSAAASASSTDSSPALT